MNPLIAFVLPALHITKAGSMREVTVNSKTPGSVRIRSYIRLVKINLLFGNLLCPLT